MEQYKKISKKKGYECLSACISNHLLESKEEIFPEDICFLGKGFRVWYERDEKVGRLSTDIYQANFNFLEKYKIRYVLGKADNYNSAYGLLCNSIKNKEKISLKVAANKLTYDSVYKNAGETSHFINILGRQKRNIFIYDGYVPKLQPTDFQGWVNEKEILAAWEKKKYEYIILKNNSVDIENKEKCIRREIIMGIECYLKKKSDSERTYGENAVWQLWRDIINLSEERDIVYYAKEVNYQLKVFGFISVKKMLTCLIRKYGINHFFVEQYSDVITTWERICMSLMKISISKNVDDIQKLENKVFECMSREKECLLKILENIY